jgi:hypothetical protein
MSEQRQGPVHRERRHKRVPTREVTATASTSGGPLTFTVANLSIGGALMTGNTASRGEVLELELKLRGSRAVIVTGRIVHVRNEGVGVAFEGVDANETAALEKLIATAEARNALPPPLPPRARTDELPALSTRPEDPFAADHDPRPPRGGSPDERAEYLRVLLKNRDETIRKGKAAYTQVVTEADLLRAVANRLKTRVDALTSQHSLTEVALAAARAETESERAAHLAERATAADVLEQEQRRTLEAIAAVSGLEATMRRHEVEAKHAVEEAEAARREAEAAVSEAANVRRAREELMHANRKAIEGQTALGKERTTRQAAERALADERAALAAAQDEARRLKDEMTRLKQKLVQTEAALERMASRGMHGVKARSPAK